MNDKRSLTAKVDFRCMEPDCEGVVAFSLFDAADNGFQVVCGTCHHAYEFDAALSEKLRKLRDLLLAIQNAEDILGDCKVAVTVPSGTVKIPYPLLLTRLNTLITLDAGGCPVDFHFRVEPASADVFK